MPFGHTVGAAASPARPSKPGPLLTVPQQEQYKDDSRSLPVPQQQLSQMRECGSPMLGCSPPAITQAIPEEAPLSVDSPPMPRRAFGGGAESPLGSSPRRHLLDTMDGVVQPVSDDPHNPAPCSPLAVTIAMASNLPPALAFSPLAKSAAGADAEAAAAAAAGGGEGDRFGRSRSGSVNTFTRQGSAPQDSDQPKKGTIGRARSRAYTYAGPKSDAGAPI
eukprot:m.82730 g.82730  ORF g.82730 m.82730 type:complete len:220 (+) comp14930_c1_seq3:1065-1724(+)